MVSVSPRIIDDLDYDEDAETTLSDPRFSFGFSSVTLESSYSDLEIPDDARAFAGTPDPSGRRRRRRQRDSKEAFDRAELFQYPTVADGDAFRLAVIQPGTGKSVVEVNLIWESSKQPARNYCGLSYCWGSVERNAAILLDGYKFPVTSNLLTALQNLRKPRTNFIIWIDQICINQDDHRERSHQVSIMKHIFNRAMKIYVWLGEADSRSDKLFDYAKKLKRGDDSPKSVLNRLLGQRDLRHAIQDLLERPWFKRVWVIPEVALSRYTTVACGRSHATWESLVRLFRDVSVPITAGFDKHTSLLGNPRQRIAIITQMASSQKEGKAHTDITQLLILGKSSEATDVRDMVYAFYGESIPGWRECLTHNTTFPNYEDVRSVGSLYVEICHIYINSILWDAAYASWHELDDQRKVFQLMAILYSAGILQHSQNHDLPSWVPDWTFAWHLAPTWITTAPNFVTTKPKDDWTTGIRSNYRAGGEEIATFVIREGSRHQLKLSAIVFDSVMLVNEMTPSSTSGAVEEELSSSPIDGWNVDDPANFRYGRYFFRTTKGYVGLATPGVRPADSIAILLGGDVPVVIRRNSGYSGRSKAYQLLCECYIEAPSIMQGEFAKANRSLAEDIVLL